MLQVMLTYIYAVRVVQIRLWSCTVRANPREFGLGIFRDGGDAQSHDIYLPYFRQGGGGSITTIGPILIPSPY